MNEDNLKVILEALEKQELESAAAGIDVPEEIYSRMLAIYLYKNDLCNAKYLWKRIPANAKSSNRELEKIWKVGQKMWHRDFAGIYEELSQEWSPVISEIMEKIKESTRDRAVRLSANAYSFITLDKLSAMIGLTREEAAEEARKAGWEVDSQAMLVKPKKPSPPALQVLSCEEQLSKLTHFVSFLEN